MVIRHCSHYAGSVSQLLCSYLLNYLHPHKEPHYLFHITISSQQSFDIALDNILNSAFLPLGARLVVMFKCQSLVYTCHISACWLLVIYGHQMSTNESCVTNKKSTQFVFTWPTTVVATFPLFNAIFNVVYRSLQPSNYSAHGILFEVIPTTSMAYFAALSDSPFTFILMCVRTLHSIIFFHWF